MAQQTAIKPYNTFVKGIITEAGPLTFPENASLDEENCVLNRDGSRQRRLGMDLEQDFVLHSATLGPQDALASFRWENVANDSTRQFVVVQAASALYFFDANPASTSSTFLGTLDGTGLVFPSTPLTFTSALGYALCCSGAYQPFYIDYNPTSGAITLHEIDMKIRDYFGVVDGLATEVNPPILTDSHSYNLRNQGWDGTKIANYFTVASVYPSNAQQWFLGKNADDDFEPALLGKQDFGTTPAPRGRFIISPFNRSVSRQAATGLVTALDIDNSRPSAVAFAFQRAFYAGMQSPSPLPTATSPNLTGMVFYSRTVRNPADLGRCYSDADPTSEVDSDLVDTDGGFISIPESGKIHRLVPKGDTLIVLADNGIWGIRGDDGGFRATVTQVVKISDFGVIGPASVVDVEDSVLYWSRGGIYLLSGEGAASNITENSIQTLFNSIPNVAKRAAVGSFDPTNRQVRWMYSDLEGYDGINYKNKYNKELVLDMVLTAFYKNTISELGEPSPYIAGYVELPDPLLPKEGVRNRGTTVTKYLVVQYVDEDTNAASISFAYYRDEGFRDWRSIDGEGVSFVSYMVTGYEIMGDTMRNKRVGYMTCHFKMTERNAVLDELGNVTADNPSGCMIQAQWDWSNHPDSGKWGEAFQGYRLLRPYLLPAAGQPINYGYEVVVTKNRLRGSGKALSVLFQSDEDKDFYLYGWSIKVSGSENV